VADFFGAAQVVGTSDAYPIHVNRVVGLPVKTLTGKEMRCMASAMAQSVTPCKNKIEFRSPTGGAAAVELAIVDYFEEL
jgi:hypothetical protein